MKLYQLSWALYIVGTAIILASYVNIVSPGVGWIGWLLGMAGFVLGLINRRGNPNVAKELERLAQLHQEGKINDQEYAEGKSHILR